jgi:hypothetical protein
VVPANEAGHLTISTAEVGGAYVLHPAGFLDSTTYLSLRDAIIRAALDEPRAVVIDVTKLVVPAPSAWVVFTSARWHVNQWPDVPMALVCAHHEGRKALHHNGIDRYVPVYPSIEHTMESLSCGPRQLRRHRAELRASRRSVGLSRDLIANWLTEWGRLELISVAKLIVTVFVENVLQHTDSAPVIRLEHSGQLVTVAVEDGSSVPAARRERSQLGGDEVSGLAIVAALCRNWGNAPTSSGKTVWAVIGPENRL